VPLGVLLEHVLRHQQLLLVVRQLLLALLLGQLQAQQVMLQVLLLLQLQLLLGLQVLRLACCQLLHAGWRSLLVGLFLPTARQPLLNQMLRLTVLLSLHL
jgi:hypothetical protein